MTGIDKLEPDVPKQTEKPKRLYKRQSVKQKSVVYRYSTFNDVVVGLAAAPTQQKDSFEQIIDDIENSDKEVFRSFVKAFLREWNVEDPKIEARILRDRELKDAVITFLKLESVYSPKIKAVKITLAKRIRERMFSYFPKMRKINQKDMDRFFFNYLFVKQVEKFRDLILETGNEKAIKIWRDGVEALRKDCAEGRVKTSKQFIKRLTKIFREAIAATDNKELQEMWSLYEKSGVEESVDFLSAKPEDSGEKSKNERKDKPVRKKDEKIKAIRQVAGDVNGVVGFELAQDNSGNAKVVIDGTFTVDMRVYKNENNEFVYYINDEYRNGDPLKVKAGDLLKTLYARQIDGLISRQLLKHPAFVNEVGQIKDRDLIRLVTKLIGKGRDKRYEINAEDRNIIKILVKILKGKDIKYSSLQKRVEILNEVLNSKQRGDYAKRLMLDNPDDFENVSEFIKAVRQ